MIKSTLLRFCCFVVFVVVGGIAIQSPVSGEELSPPTPEAMARRLQQTFRQTPGLAGEFIQVATDKMSRRARNGQGTVVISNDGRMRWNYAPPEEQVIIFDRDTILMYFAKSRQMTISSARDFITSHPIYSLFTDTKDIETYFEPVSPEGWIDPGDDFCLKLIPREAHPMVDYLYVWIDKKTWLITRIRIVDPLEFGNETDIRFVDIQIKQDIDPALFEFVPPPGTDIITEDAVDGK